MNDKIGESTGNGSGQRGSFGNWNGIRESCRIWLGPVIFLCCSILMAGLLFQYVAEVFDGEIRFDCEAVLTYATTGCMLLTCWITAKRFERIKRRPVQKKTRTYLKLFSAIYLISLTVTLACKLMTFACKLWGYCLAG